MPPESEEQSDFRILARCADRNSLLAAIRTLPPAIAVLDISVPRVGREDSLERKILRPRSDGSARRPTHPLANSDYNQRYIGE